MTRFAFLIDQDTCIGCHACTVACKSEHDVPLGVNRTWVKYIEKGEFPNSRRFYSVNRCNHCEDAPCVSICPTSALFSRKDGIVDFDDSSCIGCKSCMNACPYDALYINPDTQTAHKCNFCTHRVEVGLEPSCVVVCPTQSIFAGDIEDPNSPISQMLGRHDTKVRAPEQGTKPHVFYKGVDEAALDPLRTKILDDGLIWANVTTDHPTIRVNTPRTDANIVARTAYTTAHEMPWTGRVSAYLVTKSIAGGALMVAGLAALLGHAQTSIVSTVAPALALVFAAVTGVLLIIDLKQPKRFFYIFTRPQWGSWIVKGAFALAAFGGFGSLWFLAGIFNAPDLVRVISVPTIFFGALTAAYTAWLFGQCEGRDLWQTPLMAPVLLAQAVTSGAALLAIATIMFETPSSLNSLFTWCIFGGALAQMALVGIELTSHQTISVELAVAALTKGTYRKKFLIGLWFGMILPVAVSLTAVVSGNTSLNAIAGVLALIGLAAYEDAFVRAGQSVPLS